MTAIAAQGLTLRGEALGALSSSVGDGRECCPKTTSVVYGLGNADILKARAVTAVTPVTAITAVAALSSRKLSSEFLPLLSVPQQQQQLKATRRRTFKKVRASQGDAATTTTTNATSTELSLVEQLRGAREGIKEIIQSKHCNPILVRLGWHDSGTYNKEVEGWPKAAGATGSIRFKPEIDHGANAGLINALELVKPIKEKYPAVSYADLFQLASATAIEVAGGPKIPMRYGRVDASSPEDCALDGNLPDAAPPSPADHLRKVFYRMGLTDKDIVALSGAHTIGRARLGRSGFGKESTKYTEKGPGNPGGQSWTPEWLVFDNSYFKEVKTKRDEDLLVLPTDAALFEDEGFKVYAEKYAADQEAFFKDYAESHAKLSELGSKFDPPEGITIDEATPAADAGVEKFVAAKYSTTAAEETPKKDGLSPEMREKMRREYVSWGGTPNEPAANNFLCYHHCRGPCSCHQALHLIV